MMSLKYQMVLILCQIFKIKLNILLKLKIKILLLLTTIPPIHVYINRINNRLVFEIKDGCKLELQTLETMKLFGSAKILIDKAKNAGRYQVFKKLK